MACETWKDYRELLKAALASTTNDGKAPSLRLPDTLPTFNKCKLLYIADSGLMALGIPNGSVAKLGAFMIPLDERDPNNIFSPILIFIKCECFYIKLKEQTLIDFNELNSDNAKYADGSGHLKTYSDFVNTFNISGYTWYEAESSASSPILRGALNIADSYVQTDNSVKVQTIPSGMFTLLKNRDKLNSLDLSNNDVKIENKAENNCLINEKLGIRFPTKKGEFFWYLADIEDDIEKGGLKLTTRPLKQDLQVLDDTYQYYANWASIALIKPTNLDLFSNAFFNADTFKDCNVLYRGIVGGKIWEDNGFPIYSENNKDYYIKPYFIWMKELAGENICYTEGLLQAYGAAIQQLKDFVDNDLTRFCESQCSFPDPENPNVSIIDETCLNTCKDGSQGDIFSNPCVNGPNGIVGCEGDCSGDFYAYSPENNCTQIGETCTKTEIDCNSASLAIKDCLIKEHYTITKTTGEYLSDEQVPEKFMREGWECNGGRCNCRTSPASDTYISIPQINESTIDTEDKWGSISYTQQTSKPNYYENKPGGNYHIVYKCCK